MGKVRPVFGIGLGYTFADRFTIKSGFYTANKVYTADPYDYKWSSPPPNVQYLVQIDANCKVYEIPLTLSYSFAQSKKHNWFGSAGLSSYIMKEETYDYLYKYPSGATYSHRYYMSNENKHFLSVLSLSGGYTRKLNNRFSIFPRVSYTSLTYSRLSSLSPVSPLRLAQRRSRFSSSSKA